MAQCPKCQSSNVAVTEEVYTRKGRAYYRFLQVVFTLLILIFFFSNQEYATGFVSVIGVNIIIWVLSLINASKRATSKTKISCLECKYKTYI
jgi:predicted nucleic-acid-binding Zn-ribbon protein